MVFSPPLFQRFWLHPVLGCTGSQSSYPCICYVHASATAQSLGERVCVDERLNQHQRNSMPQLIASAIGSLRLKRSYDLTHTFTLGAHSIHSTATLENHSRRIAQYNNKTLRVRVAMPHF
jgi:hypothetical protein